MAYEFDVAEVRRLCPESTTVTLEPGAVLFHEGDPGDALYLLLTGALKIAGGIAITRSEVLRVEPQTFLSLVSGNPDFALNLLRISTRRLRKMNWRHLRSRAQVADIPLEAVSAG